MVWAKCVLVNNHIEILIAKDGLNIIAMLKKDVFKSGFSNFHD